MDSDHQVILAEGVSEQPQDVELLTPVLQRIDASADPLSTVMTMDAGSWSEGNVKAWGASSYGGWRRPTVIGT